MAKNKELLKHLGITEKQLYDPNSVEEIDYGKLALKSLIYFHPELKPELEMDCEI